MGRCGSGSITERGKPAVELWSGDVGFVAELDVGAGNQGSRQPSGVYLPKGARRGRKHYRKLPEVLSQGLQHQGEGGTPPERQRLDAP